VLFPGLTPYDFFWYHSFYQLGSLSLDFDNSNNVLKIIFIHDGRLVAHQKQDSHNANCRSYL
jgi:hypothetical protein